MLFRFPKGDFEPIKGWTTWIPTILWCFCHKAFQKIREHSATPTAANESLPSAFSHDEALKYLGIVFTGPFVVGDAGGTPIVQISRERSRWDGENAGKYHHVVLSTDAIEGLFGQGQAAAEEEEGEVQPTIPLRLRKKVKCASKNQENFQLIKVFHSDSESSWSGTVTPLQLLVAKCIMGYFKMSGCVLERDFSVVGGEINQVKLFKFVLACKISKNFVMQDLFPEVSGKFEHLAKPKVKELICNTASQMGWWLNRTDRNSSKKLELKEDGKIENATCNTAVMTELAMDLEIEESGEEDTVHSIRMQELNAALSAGLLPQILRCSVFCCNDRFVKYLIALRNHYQERREMAEHANDNWNDGAKILHMMRGESFMLTGWDL